LAPAPFLTSKPESFQAGLQALLASLSRDENGLNLEEPVEIEVQRQPDAAAQDALRNSTPPNSNRGSAAAFRKGFSATSGGGPSAIATRLPMIDDQAAPNASTPAPNAPRRLATESVQRQALTTQSNDAGPAPVSTHSASKAKNDPASTQSKRALNSEKESSVLQVEPAAIAPNPPENFPAPGSSLPQSDLPMALPGTLTVGSPMVESPRASVHRNHAGPLSAPGPSFSQDVQVAERTVTPALAEARAPAAKTDAVESRTGNSRAGWSGGEATNPADSPHQAPESPPSAIDAGISESRSRQPGASVMDLQRSGGSNRSADRAYNSGIVSADPLPVLPIPPSALPSAASASEGTAIEAANFALDAPLTTTVPETDTAHQSSTITPNPISIKAESSGAGYSSQRAKTWANASTTSSVPLRASAPGLELGRQGQVIPSAQDPPIATEVLAQPEISRIQLSEPTTLAPEVRNQVPAQAGSKGLTKASAATSREGASKSPTENEAAAKRTQSSPLSPIVEKSSLAVDDVPRPRVRTSSASQASGPAERTDHHGETQSASRIVELRPGIDELSGTNAVASTARGAIAGPAGPSAASVNREVFTALDARMTAATPALPHAGAQRAEAGFHDPSLGWVGVRADSEGGGIHASLVPGSTGAAQALGTQMPGLSSYLAEQHTPVQTLTLAAPENHAAAYSLDQGGSQGLQQGMGQNTGQSAGQGTDPEALLSPQQSSSPSTTVPSEMEASANGGLGENGETTRPGGQHVSVIA
jgi:hypothetical protein